MQFVASRASDPSPVVVGKTCDNFRRAVRFFTDGRSKSDGPSGHSTAPSSTSPPELDPSRLNPNDDGSLTTGWVRPSSLGSWCGWAH
jgi:hypothetical protein